MHACSHAPRRRLSSASLGKYASFLSSPLLSSRIHPPKPACLPAAMTRGNKSSCRRRRGSHARRPCLSLASISMFPLFYICVMFSSSSSDSASPDSSPWLHYAGSRTTPQVDVQNATQHEDKGRRGPACTCSSMSALLLFSPIYSIDGRSFGLMPRMATRTHKNDSLRASLRQVSKVPVITMPFLGNDCSSFATYGIKYCIQVRTMCLFLTDWPSKRCA